MKNEMNTEMKENENRLKMIKPLRSPTEQETRKLFGIALERLINMSMGNHIYCFNNINRIQSEGGATGLDETGELADLLMLWWIDEFLAALKKLNLNLDLLTLFKDDLGVITDKIPIGMDLDLIEGKLVPKEAQNTVEISEEQHTAKILCQVADNVLEMLS